MKLFHPQNKLVVTRKLWITLFSKMSEKPSFELEILDPR